jgi:hypothetical protein
MDKIDNLGRIVKVAGPLVVAENMTGVKMYDVVYVSENKIMGEIIEISNAIIDGNFVAEIQSCEPYFNQAFTNNTRNINYPEKNEFHENVFTETIVDNFNKESEFYIYPNPADNRVSIRLAKKYISL